MGTGKWEISSIPSSADGGVVESYPTRLRSEALAKKRLMVHFSFEKCMFTDRVLLLAPTKSNPSILTGPQFPW